MLETLKDAHELYIIQRRELAELIGFETRNKYSIETEQNQSVGFAAEQQKGIFGFLARQFLGHWRSYEILFFVSTKQVMLRAVHPFRFFFQRLEVFQQDGVFLGAIQQRFSLLTKRFDLQDAYGNVCMTVSSPFWKIWTFPFKKREQVVAVIEKKWSGFLTEAFLDKDKFRIQFQDPSLSIEEKCLLLASGIFIDLQYFEKKAQ